MVAAYEKTLVDKLVWNGIIYEDYDVPKEDRERKLTEKVFNHSDSLFASLERISVKLDKAVVTNEGMKLIDEYNLPEGYYGAKGKIKFSLPDSVFEIKYTYFFSKNAWKLFEISDRFDIYSKDEYYYEPSDIELEEDDRVSVGSIEVPKFKDPEVQKLAEEYAIFFMESYTLANDASKAEAYTKKAQDWGERMQQIIPKLSESPEEMKKFTDFIQKLAMSYQDSYDKTDKIAEEDSVRKSTKRATTSSGTKKKPIKNKPVKKSSAK
ncbi:MAG: hypothetical protein IPJ81_07370 [Chitinophagaceae bacterium]|nr:hypothetical protein [Chitinophagaceae bacterium]